MLTQCQILYLELKKGPVHQYWGFRQDPPIARLAARINDLERPLDAPKPGFGCDIEHKWVDGQLYYILKSTPGDDVILPANFTNAMAKAVSKPEAPKAVARSTVELPEGFGQMSLLDACK